MLDIIIALAIGGVVWFIAGPLPERFTWEHYVLRRETQADQRAFAGFFTLAVLIFLILASGALLRG